MKKTYVLSANGIDDWLYDYIFAARKACGSDMADVQCYALQYYVNTGRACTDFLKLLLKSSPADIARITIAGGSCSEILGRIKKKIGWKENCML